MTRIALILAAALTLTAPAVQAAGPQEEANKKVVLPNAADGPEGLRAFLGFLREKFPASRSEVKSVFAKGDYVILHVHAVREPGTRGSAIVDIFKLEGGKIVEHWDAVQPVPEKALNANGMF